MEELVNYNLIFAENQRIETERLILRPVSLMDASDMHIFASDDETTLFIYEKHDSLQDTQQVIANYFMKEPFGKYGIVLKATKHLIGTIDLRVDEQKVTGELGYVLNRQYWNQGYTSEASIALLYLAFEQLKLIRVNALYNEKNPASGGVMQKIGMNQAGYFKNYRIFRGVPVNYLEWAITREEWRATH
ncbi:GNAT family N-acetyltransferase [Enterococcus sp. HY326]|uniref:GNAT family N-acetyltransferase n=1 Tax=Enterococcus sp. HY326 TaxID=2971265 RepID=UPI0022409F69|nr:GNAT family protein [Enterococcus sp. HY326]